MLIGYARCSTADQNLDWMHDALHDGDTVIVCELMRLGRSTKDLFELVESINACSADILSLKESCLDTTTPHGKLLFTLSAGISQFEGDLIHERTMDGLAEARARGRLGGRPKTDEKKIQQAFVVYDAKNIPIWRPSVSAVRRSIRT